MSLLLLNLIVKQYIYEKNRYQVRIIGIGYFSIFLLLYGIYSLITTGSIMYLTIIMICLYIIYETFITCANPNKIMISDKEIIFESPWHKDSYRWDDIVDFRVKELPNRKQVYIRINKDQFDIMKGRYWVYCFYFNQADELYDFFLDKEAQIHPDSIKAKNRRESKIQKKK